MPSGQSSRPLATGPPANDARSRTRPLLRPNLRLDSTLGGVTSPANWYEDPTGRFERRYWDGTAWTDHVWSTGTQSLDAPEASRPADALPMGDKVRSLPAIGVPPGLLIAVIAGALVLGMILGRAVPPPYPDGQWWGTFLTSAGFGGSVAFIGATIAAVIALHNSRSDRRQKQEAEELTQWWGRFTWACEKAVSKEPGESEMGLSVLSALIDAPWARDEDNEMAIGVANVIADAINATRTTSGGDSGV